jgi:hypothetical protein
LDTIDSELRLVATLGRAARERGGPLPSIAAADELQDERRELTGSRRLVVPGQDVGSRRVGVM